MSDIIVGDCRETLKDVPSSIADLCIADPPYGDTSLRWDVPVRGWITQVARVLKPSASIWLFGSLRYLAKMFPEIEQAGFCYSQDIVWEKQNGTGFHADRFRRVHEHLVLFYRGAWADVHHEPQFSLDETARTVRRKTRPTHTGHIENGHYISQEGGPRLLRTVQFTANEHGAALHPTQKPLSILAPIIRYSCPAGGMILDPFAGVGSVGITAEMLGRRCISCELNPEYVDLHRKRTAQQTMPLEKSGA